MSANETKNNVSAIPQPPATSTTPEKQEESPYVVKLSKTYRFDDKEYCELDLSGLEDLTASDLFVASKTFATEGYISPKPEADPQFCCTIAEMAAGLYKGDLKKLSLKDATKVRNVVFNFFQDAD